MLDLDRRSAMGLAAALPLASALPSLLAGTAHAADVPAGKAAWDLTDLYPTLEAWDAARQKVLAALPRLSAYQGTLGTSAEAMAKAFTDISDVSKEADRVAVYAGLRADEDLRIAKNSAAAGIASDMYSALGQATAWVDPEVLTIGKDKVDSFIAASDTLKRRFAFRLRDTLRMADHTLGTEAETVLAAASAPLSGPGEIRGQLVSADMPWKSITLSDGTTKVINDAAYTIVRSSPVREDRKAAAEAVFSVYGQFEHALGAVLTSKVKGDVFRAQARKYPSTLAMAVADDNVPESVYRTLITEAGAGLPQLHRYFELRRKLLKLPDIHYYDIYPPLVSLDRKFTLPDMRTLTLAGLAPLGPDYARQLSTATAAKWMDPFPRPGKTSGAYMSGGAYDVHPYLLLNMGEDYEGLTTYAHEWGHAMHSLLTVSSQPYELSNYPTFTAEIASTCNELLLSEYMIGRAKTKEEKIYYLGMRLEGLRGTFFRQTMFAEFELKIHEMVESGAGASGEAFSAAYFDLLKRYQGPQFALDDLFRIEWAYIPHFLNYTYYIYQYATSITAGTWFARSILKGGKAERENYLNVLRAGGSEYPVDLLKRSGLDMTSPEPYRELIAGFGKTIDEIEALMG